ncbi:MAG: thioredoxin domain-containing protein [Patescibacteria group bacterium]
MIELIDFYADWCHPCHLMHPIIEEIEKEHAGKLTVTKIDVDKEPERAAEFNVLSIPTYVIKKDGKVVEQFSGAVSKEVLVGKLGL